jgi:hypothetical protein
VRPWTDPDTASESGSGHPVVAPGPRIADKWPWTALLLLLMSLKRLLWFAVIAFAIFFVISSPTEAGRLVKSTGESAGDWFGHAATSLAKFLKTLT